MLEIKITVDDLNQISVTCPPMPLTTALGLMEVGKVLLVERSKNPKIVVPSMRPNLSLVPEGNGDSK